jgi:lipopolysaccharide transport system permease protein
LAPLAQLGILSFVFRIVVPVNIPNFSTFLFVGLLPWTWFQSSLLAAATAARQNKDLVQQVGFPVAILPVISIASEFLHLVMALPILVFFMWFDGHLVSAALLALPAILVCQFLLTLGLAFFVAPLQAIFHDTEHLLRIGLTLLFYLSAVFYAPESVPQQFALFYELNPIVYLLSSYRSVLLDGAVPALLPFVAWTAVFAALAAAGYWFYMRLYFRFIQET